ncbi:hypothetical protein [Mycobacterium haemophilum]
MAISEPGKMNAPFTFYNHGNGKLGESISVNTDHVAGTVNISIRRPVESARIAQVSDQQAEWFGHLTLHRHDLRTATLFLDELDRLDSADDESHTTACTALWIAAVVATIKCFDRTSAARDELDADTALGTNTPVRADFDHVKSLRNKHISHDENDWLRAVPVAIIDDPDGTPTVASFHGMVIHGESANADNIARLRRVIAKTMAWVEAEWNQQAEALLNDLRSRSKSDLAALPDVAGPLPNERSAGTRRQSL